MAITRAIRGLMILNNESPLDLSAVNSLFSEKLPKVINEEMRIAKGRARGIRLAET